MQTYVVNLKSQPSNTFRCQKAADALDINIEKKLQHNLKISADLKTNYNIGLIVGSSGSGKTTLANNIFSNDCFYDGLNEEIPIIDQLPTELSYDECATILSGVGLTQVPCWIRPVKTLSTGQKYRAMVALIIASKTDKIVIDEWTSTVDRTIAKIMSHAIKKYAKKTNGRIVLCSCHYDIIDWLEPDWVIDCNEQKYIEHRGLLWQRSEQIKFTISEASKNSWKSFSRYHYLNERLPGGKNYFYGLFHKDKQIGFQCFSNYVPHRKGTKLILHSNRTVIHPDYVGFGLGIKIINLTSEYIKKNVDCRVMAKFSSIPVYKSMARNKEWKLLRERRDLKTNKSGYKRFMDGGGFRTKVKTFSFEYLGKN